MGTLQEVQDQIKELRKLEERMLAEERTSVISEIRAQIDRYRISSAELGLGGGPKRRGGAAQKVIRYRDGANTWSGGRGRKPTWVLEKLAAGEDIEKYRVA